MSDNTKLICDTALVVASIYGLTTAGDKKLALIGYILFLADGGFAVAAKFSRNRTVLDLRQRSHSIAVIAGIDCLTVEICKMSGLDEKLALLFLICPAIDIIMREFLDEHWDLLTEKTHFVDLIFMIFYAVRDVKYILGVTAVSFFGAQYGRVKPHLVSALYALGVFASCWFLQGKDVPDITNMFK